ncbi:MAG: amidase [Sulfitobacter sp.]
MTTDQLHLLSVAELGQKLRSGALSSVALTEYTLARIEKLNPKVQAFILVTDEHALRRAAQADEEFKTGVDKGPLQGIPYGLKDIYNTAGIATTCNSRLMLDHVPKEDAHAVDLINTGGGVLVGKLNTHEFALGGPDETLPFETARNPWNVKHFTGGSSSGSGVAVGAGMVRVALGSDTGGSIRSPASHCGVVGLKPTYGLVSRRGVFPLSYSLDHCGPVSWTVQDAALTMNVIAGFDKKDPSSLSLPQKNYAQAIGKSVKGMRIALARNLYDDVPDRSQELVDAMESAAERYVSLGAIVERIQLPDFDQFKACQRVIMLAEAYAIHEADLKSRPQDFGRYTYQRIAAAAGLSAADYIQAQRLRRELTVSFNAQVFDKGYDALITATNVAPASLISDFPFDWPPPSIATAINAPPFSVTGNPALTIPIGFSQSGLPFGMQVVCKLFDEITMFQVASAFEASAGVTHVRPSLDEVG